VNASPSAATRLASPPGELRQAVRDSLQAEPAFAALQGEDQRAIAHSLVRIAHAAKLLEAESAAAPVAARPLTRAMDAGDHLGGRAVSSMAGTTTAMINAISFPRFVNELITGVFKAMVQTNQQQMQQYVELVRGVSQSLEGFSSLGGSSDDPAKRWLADQFPQSFAIEAPDPDDAPRPGEPVDPDDQPEGAQLITRGPPPSQDALRSALSLEPGEQVPSSGGPELVAFVRRSLARNRQQVLATMVQMGMQRIVVDSGRISAAMRFHIDATSAAAEQNHSGFDTRTTIGASASASLGWWSASASVSSTIGYVSTTDVQTREEVSASADLTSSVELHFRTDQVPLDRIASQQTVQRLQLNTLNPERELQIAAETDRARIAARPPLQPPQAARPAATTPAATTPTTTTPTTASTTTAAHTTPQPTTATATHPATAGGTTANPTATTASQPATSGGAAAQPVASGGAATGTATTAPVGGAGTAA
jgi:hypothetical protein